VEPLVVGINRQGQVLLNNQAITDTQLAQQVTDYLNKHPKGSVVLKADKGLQYEKVVQVLGTLQEIGSDRVSLAVE
jgi:biopolymer transport protein ExbD